MVACSGTLPTEREKFLENQLERLVLERDRSNNAGVTLYDIRNILSRIAEDLHIIATKLREG